MDSNVISALWSNEPSAERLHTVLDKARREGQLVVSPVVYGELRAHPGLLEKDVRQELAESNIAIDFEFDERTWALAGERYARYAAWRRASGGDSPRRLLPDLLIGAHAMRNAERFLTLDKRFYQRYFPELYLL